MWVRVPQLVAQKSGSSKTTALSFYAAQAIGSTIHLRLINLARTRQSAEDSLAGSFFAWFADEQYKDFLSADGWL